MARSTAQLIGGIRRLSTLARTARDEETVLRALRRELRAGLEVDEVAVEERPDAAATSLPLLVEGRVHRHVVLRAHPPRSLGADETEAACALVEAAAAVLSLLEAREAARVDPLTGALNHGAMLARLAEEADRARRYGVGLACLLIDLDDFKQINDHWGHATGDAVLRRAAAALRAEFRTHDQVARYGGDEFVVILPYAVGARAEIAARRALRSLHDVHVVAGDERVLVRASIGIAEWVEGESVTELLDRADRGLLAGKRGGKGQLRRASPSSG